MTGINEQVFRVFRAAVECNICFEGTALRRSAIDLAQPRFIGQDYWSCTKRVLILLINPGSGVGRHDGADVIHRDLIEKFRSGEGSIEEIFRHQSGDIGKWGRFVSFFIDRVGLRLSQVALAKIAWCATEGNRYPAAMLHNCFNRHTAALLRALNPQIILLSGARVHDFHGAVAEMAPAARLILAPHYANRAGTAFLDSAAERIRTALIAG